VGSLAFAKKFQGIIKMAFVSVSNPKIMEGWKADTIVLDHPDSLLSLFYGFKRFFPFPTGWKAIQIQPKE